MAESPAATADDHVARNREAWDRMAVDYVESGHRDWASNEVTWGIFRVPEARIGMLPDDLTGMDTIELGCGTGYVSAWLARRGAHPVGIDNSPAQLETARRFQQEFGIDFPLHLGDAEQTPFAGESFDFAISEYGAAIWCDPYRWIPEVARILRPGGRLSFLGNSVFLMLTSPLDDEDTPAGERLERPLFGMHRFAWGDGAVEFHLPHGEMLRLLRGSGFEIEDLVEVQIPEGATTSYPFVTAEWARQWPCEEVWKVRKR
ncbi:MAG: class I SAM-dependent methyltransferase [Chloroflexia bacterium]|nr:class I SAM-dependent methyltransferase [Chloroflexia bacterium]